MNLEDVLSKPHTKAGRIQRACLELIREHEADGALPTSVRFLFYELEGRGIVPKAYLKPDGSKRARQPDQDVSAALTVLREIGEVRWEWIVDETRRLDSWAYAKSVRAYVLERLGFARIDLWGGEAPPLILCESRSLAGVLSDIAATYLCPIAATGGQSAGFLHTQVVPLIEAAGWAGERTETQVLYFGDLDLSGGHIEQNTHDVLYEYSPLDWRRLAITPAQVDEHNLTVIEKRDHRFKPPRTFPAVETEALSQRRIQQILTGALDDMVSVPLADALETEERQRVQVREVLETLQNDDFEPL